MATGDGVARVLTWVPGTPWASLPAHDAAALASLGRSVALLDAALADFTHPALDRPLAWNMLAADALRDDARAAADTAASHDAGAGADPRGRAAAVAASVLARFAADVEPALRALPAQAIHNDANDHNVLVDTDGHVGGPDRLRRPRAAHRASAASRSPAPTR